MARTLLIDWDQKRLTAMLDGGGWRAGWFAIGVTVPVLPVYVENRLHGSGTMVGIAVGAFAVSAALLRPRAIACYDARRAPPARAADAAVRVVIRHAGGAVHRVVDVAGP